MRRSRHKLQVSTFPFLAVLLGAMGALILLLLVMDRRSKIVARNKAIAAHAIQVAAKSKRQDHHLHDEEARRAEWERKRRELHELLGAQEKELALERNNLDAKLNGVTQDLKMEKKALTDLEKNLLEERGRLDVKSQLLTQMRLGIARSAKLDDASKLEAEELARDLAQLERVLQEAKTLKSQEQETYSLVPYRGKLGESRQPVYVECTATGLIFHPERRRLENPEFDILTFRNAVQRRGVELVREKRDPDRPSRPPLPKVTSDPYVLFLVRPDGLESYYNATTALRGFELDFGYEFIDAQWSLDFSQGEGIGGQKLSLPHGPSKVPKPTGAPKGTFAGQGFPSSGLATRNGPSLGPIAGSSLSEGLGAGRFGFGPPGSGIKQGGGFPLSASEPGVQGTGTPASAGGQSDRGTGRDPRLGPLASANPSGVTGSASPFAVTGIAPKLGASEGAPGLGLSINSGGRALNQGPQSGTLGSGTNIGPASNSGQPGNSNPAGLTTGPGNSGGDPSGGGLANAQGIPWRSGKSDQPGISNPPERTGGPGNPGGDPSDEGPASAQDIPWRGSPTSAPQASDAPSGSGSAPRTRGSPGSSQAAFNGADGADPGSMDPFARVAPNIPFADTRPGPKKPAAAPSLGRLLANRDYILTVECFGDVVALYPSSQVFSVANGANQQNIDDALVQAVLQLIARRQATVRSGETPYRPMLRFQVHPEALRTYFHVYPLFEHLRIPMARENLAN